MTRYNVAAVILWMVGTLVSFSATALSVRVLSQSIGVFDILTCRSAAGVAICLALALVRPKLLADLRPRRVRLHLARNAVHFLGTYTWTVGLTLLPLATVFALEFTTPAWVALLAVLVLRERMTRSRAASILAGVAGVVVILRPGVEALQPASLVVLASAVAFAITTIATKKLTATESTFSILLWMNAMQLPLNLAGSDPAFWMKLDATHIWPLLGICIGGLSSHYCLTNAYRHGDATMVVPLDFLRLPLIALIGWRFYGEALDPFVFLGSLFIIAGILWNLRAEARSPSL